MRLMIQRSLGLRRALRAAAADGPGALIGAPFHLGEILVAQLETPGRPCIGPVSSRRLLLELVQLAVADVTTAASRRGDTATAARPVLDRFLALR